MSKQPQTTEEKIIVAEGLKKEGNELFAKKEYKKAIATYKRVFLYINGLNQNLSSVLSGSSQSNELGNVAKLRASVNMNISFCYFKLANYKKALEHIQVTCGLEKDNAKANFRRAQVCLALGDLDTAQADLEIARRAFPEDRAIQEEYRVLQDKFAQHHVKEKQIFKKMFE